MADVLWGIPTFASAFAAAAAALTPFFPVVLVVIAVVAVVVVAALVINNWDKITSFFEKAYERGKVLVGAAATTVADAVENSIRGAQLMLALIAFASLRVFTPSETRIRELKEPAYTVYVLLDERGNVQYVGRTKRPSDRERAHRNSHRAGLSFKPIASGLTRIEARGLEQIMMLHCHTLNTANEINNQIRGISPNNKRLQTYMEAARGIARYIDNQVTNEILNWTGR